MTILKKKILFNYNIFRLLFYSSFVNRSQHEVITSVAWCTLCHIRNSF